MPKMMLTAPKTRCLRDSHTNFQVNVGIGTTCFWRRLQLVCKNQRWKYKIYLFKIWSYIFLFVHRNQYAILFAATHVHMPKNDAVSNTYQLFKGYSYKFPNQNVGIGISYFLGILQWAFCSHTSTFSCSVFTNIYYFDQF